MTRASIFEKIEQERAYQDGKWGDAFDKLNTANDWVAYISKYLGMSVTLPWNEETFRKAMLKVATLAVAVLEREEFPPRHYDK